VELSAEHKQAAADMRDAAGRSVAQAVQVANATTRADALSALYAVMVEAGAARDAANALFMLIDAEGEE
jgi:hypothetical protein